MVYRSSAATIPADGVGHSPATSPSPHRVHRHCRPATTICSPPTHSCDRAAATRVGFGLTTTILSCHAFAPSPWIYHSQFNQEGVSFTAAAINLGRRSLAAATNRIGSPPCCPPLNSPFAFDKLAVAVANHFGVRLAPLENAGWLPLAMAYLAKYHPTNPQP